MRVAGGMGAGKWKTVDDDYTNNTGNFAAS